MSPETDLIYYSTIDGKIINKEVAEALENHEKSVNRVGITNKNVAIVENGYVTNYQNLAYTNPVKILDFSAYKKPDKEMIEKIKAKSIQRKKTIQKRNHEAKKKIDIKKRNRALRKIRAFAIGVLAASITIGSVNAISEFKDSHTRGNTINQITIAANPEMSSVAVNLYPKTILKRNTIMNYDGTFFYDHSGIAKDLISLPPVLFDGALYSVYSEMGPHRKNNLNDNIGMVVHELSAHSNADNNPLVFAKTQDCHNFEEYLIKNGFVDKDGNPNVDKFIEYSKVSLETFNEYAKNHSDEYIGSYKEQLGLTDTEDSKGGR